MWTTTSKTVSLKVVKNKLAELKKNRPWIEVPVWQTFMLGVRARFCYVVSNTKMQHWLEK